MQEFSLDMLSYNCLEVIAEYQKIFLDYKRYGQFDIQKAKLIITRYQHVFTEHTIQYIMDYLKSPHLTESERYKWVIIRDLILEYTTLFLLFEDVFNIQFKRQMMRIKIRGSKSISVNKALQLMFQENNPDSKLLHESYARQMDKLNPLYLKILNKYQTNAQMYGYDSFLKMMGDNQQFNIDQLLRDAREYLDNTASLYQTQLDAISRPYLHKSWDEVTYKDMWKLFSGFWLPKKPITGEQMIILFDKTCASLGFIFQDNELIDIDLESRENKVGQAFCGFPCGSQNQKIVIIVHPMSYFGDLVSFYHAGGLAVQLSNIDPSLNPLFRSTGDFSISETLAFLFKKLLHNSAYLQQALGYSPEIADKLADFFSFLFLYRQRKINSQFIFLYRLFENSWQLTPDQFEKIIFDTEQQFKQDYGFERKCHDFLSSIEEKPFMAAHFLRADQASDQIEAKLSRKFGSRWWCNLEAGEFLRENYLVYGYSRPFDQLLRDFLAKK